MDSAFELDAAVWNDVRHIDCQSRVHLFTHVDLPRVEVLPFSPRSIEICQTHVIGGPCDAFQVLIIDEDAPDDVSILA